MSEKCVVAIFETVRKGLTAWEVLFKAGYTREQVSFLSGDASPKLFGLQSEATLQSERNQPTSETQTSDSGSPAGTATGLGAGVGSAVAAPIARGSLVFPLFIVGPLLGAGLGAVIGGMFDAEKIASDEDSEPTYADRLRRGGAILIVTGTDHQLDKAKVAMKTCDPIDMIDSELGET